MRFENWKKPKIIDGKPTKYNWIVQNLEGFTLGSKRYWSLYIH